MSNFHNDPTRIHCREHPDAVLIEDYTADQICTVFGLVGDRTRTNAKSEWRIFRNEKTNADPSRVGGPKNPLLNGSDLSTMIGDGRRAATFKEFGLAKDQNVRNKKIKTADSALMNAFLEINQMADRINLPKTIVDLFKMVHDGKKLKGRSNDAIASACLYIACRQEGVPRTFKEVCEVSKISKKQIGRYFKMICKVLDTFVELIPTGNFISRYCSNLGLPSSTQRVATAIATAAVTPDIVPERSPIVAAAVIYMASQASEIKRSQKDIGDVAGVSVLTIRQTYKLMYPRAEKLFPKDFKFHTPSH